MAEAAIRTAGQGSAGAANGGKVPGPAATIDLRRFCRRFALFGFLSYTAASFLPESLTDRVNRSTAEAATLLLGIFGRNSVVEGATITDGTFHAVIVPECTPLFMVLLLCSFVAAAPAPGRKKEEAILLGIPLLSGLNLVRIAAVVAVGEAYPRQFEPVHVYLGQFVMLFALLALCMIWFRSVTSSTPFDGMAPLFVRFTALSALPFLLWLHLNKSYVMLGDGLVRYLFSLFGQRLVISYDHDIYMQTFNLVAFATLVFATNALSPSRKFWGITAGLAALSAPILLLRISNVLFTAFHLQCAADFAVPLNAAGEFLLPVILWMVIVSGKRSSPMLYFPPSPQQPAKGQHGNKQRKRSGRWDG